jgi:K+-sensing histidine kinase KdpD
LTGRAEGRILAAGRASTFFTGAGRETRREEAVEILTRVQTLPVARPWSQVLGPRGSWQAAIGITAAASTAAMVLSLLLQPLAEQSVFLLFIPAVVVSAWLGGLVPGLAAGTLGAVFVSYHLLPPSGTLRPERGSDVLLLGLFLTIAGMIGSVTDSLRRAREAAERSARESDLLATELQDLSLDLEQQIDESRQFLEELAERNETLALAREAAEQAREEAEAADREKNALLTIVSRELRMPLNALYGYVDLLGMEVYGPLTPEQRHAVGRIRHNQEHLLGVVDGVLARARIDPEVHPREHAEIPAAALVERVRDRAEPGLRARGVLLACQPVPRGTSVLGDPARVEEALLGLLGDVGRLAAAGGEITLACRPGDDQVLFETRLPGAEPLPQERLDDLFQPYARMHTDVDPDAEAGIPLGFSLHRALARSMQGDLLALEGPSGEPAFLLYLPRALPA